MRLVYFGSGAFGVPTLDRLARGHDVALVVTQPDRPAGRRRKETATPISMLAETRGLPTLKPLRVNEPEVLEAIRATGAEAFVVIAYGHKLGPTLLDVPLAINLHASLLPKYRGAAPINRAMMNGETRTGVSVITLAQTMDAGDVLAQRGVTIDPGETAGELHDRLADLGPEIVAETLEAFARGALEPLVQDETRVTLAPKLSKREGTADFDASAAAVRGRVHGLTPWPGCTVTVDGARLALRRVAVVEGEVPGRETPGEILPDLTVRCRPGALRLLSVQRPGGREMSFAAYCRGHDVGPGARIEALPAETP